MPDSSVSVIIPNYNHARFLPRCLEALLHQSLRPHEVIVVDDDSTDDSLKVLAALAQTHPALRLHRNERNLGVNPTMNRGLELATGDYVFFSAADDEVKPGLLEQSLRLLQAHPQAGLCSSVCQWHDTATGLTWLFGAGMPPRPGYLSPAELVALGRRGKLAISGPNAVFKRSALVAAGAWRPELRWFSDWFGAYVVGFRHGICHCPDVLATFNLSPTSYYNTARSRGERREVITRILELLGTDRYADAAPLIAASGILGAFGWPVLRVVARPEHRRFLTALLVRRVARRTAEATARRCLPRWLAALGLRLFYRGTHAKNNAASG